jgi:acyl-CoA-binding protein
MSLEGRFIEAQQRVMNLARRPPNETLLQIYALFKQATIGDVTGKRPGLLDVKGRAKFDAWAAKKGMTREQAQQAYVQLVERLAVEDRR